MLFISYLGGSSIKKYGQWRIQGGHTRSPLGSRFFRKQILRNLVMLEVGAPLFMTLVPILREILDPPLMADDTNNY